jgi:hypothetical protein
VVLDTASKVPRDGNAKLLGDKRYDIRVDYYAGVGGNPGVRLYWSTESQQEGRVIPNEYFYPPPASIIEPKAPDPTAAPAQPYTVAHGVLLADGSFLPGSVTSTDDKTLRFSYRERKPIPIPLKQVAWLVFRPLTAGEAGKIPSKGVGLLTLTGDFIEGECQEISSGKAKLSSVVFGVSSFDTDTQTAAVVYRDAGNSTAPWTIRTTSGGLIRASTFRVERQTLIAEEPSIGPIELPLREIVEVSAS